MEERKDKKGLIILISVLVAFLLIGVCCFIGYKYGLNKRNTNEINNENNTKNKENITLDITSKTYDNNTKTLPEHLFDVYLSEVGQYFGLKEKYNISDPYDDKLKMIVLFYNFEPDHLYYDCSELYSDLKPEDEELEWYMIHSGDTYGLCPGNEVYGEFYEYSKMVELSNNLFGKNVVKKQTYDDGYDVFDYQNVNQIREGFIRLEWNGGDTYRGEFELTSSKIENNQLLLYINFRIADEIFGKYVVSFDIGKNNEVVFSSFEVVK